MAIQRMVLNQTSYFGAGARSKLEEETKGFQKALVVTDKELIQFGITNMVTDVLDQMGFPYQIYSDIKPNPTMKNVKDGLVLFQKSNADLLIAIGGGSVIDTAKAIGIIHNNPEFADVKSLEGVADTQQASVPIIALPTTAGTAAEVTINYVITNEEENKKMVCVDPHDIPLVAIVDAELMYSMPKSLTAATGMDALTHAIEGFITKGAWEMSDMFELTAIEMIYKHLQNAVEHPKDTAAREGMAVAQYIAGMGFSNVGLGIVHSMAHPLGALYDTPHGVANALLLPYVMEYNLEAAKHKYPAIAKAMGVSIENLTEEEAAKAAVEAVRQLSQRIQIPQKLSEIGIRQEDLPSLAQQAFQDVCTGGNPKDTSVQDILALYQKAY